ncbi:MAG: DUF1924 domain-containing protein [Betaproteobacteria bacterium]|nr:DUF1924 domain-containing protein [Betaproteobacteria bacterium]
MLLLAGAATAWSATPRELAQSYTAEASRLIPGFQGSAQRGAEFYARRFAVSSHLPACSACHTDSPARIGRHAVTGKTIQPLSPSAVATRFSDPAKVEKWFRRNCTEVLGRECSAAEKADFIAFATEGT